MNETDSKTPNDAKEMELKGEQIVGDELDLDYQVLVRAVILGDFSNTRWVVSPTKYIEYGDKNVFLDYLYRNQFGACDDREGNVHFWIPDKKSTDYLHTILNHDCKKSFKLEMNFICEWVYCLKILKSWGWDVKKLSSENDGYMMQFTKPISFCTKPVPPDVIMCLCMEFGEISTKHLCSPFDPPIF